MLRVTVAALVAVFTFGGILQGQTFTPLPWYNAQQLNESQPTAEELKVRATLLAQLSATAARLQVGETDPQRRADRERADLQRAEENRLRLSALAGMNECTLPDGTTRPVNTKATVRGWSYLCVEVLDSHLVRSGVAWTRVAD